jgi:hypothetical protein
MPPAPTGSASRSVGVPPTPDSCVFMMEAGGPDPAAGADDRRLSALSELLPQPPSPRQAGHRGLPSVASLPLLSPRGGDQCLAPSLPTHFHPPLHSSLPPVWSHVTSIRLSLESHLVCDPRTLLHVSKVTSAVRPPKRFLAATRFVAPPFPRRCPPSFPHVPHTMFHVACCTFIPPAMLFPDAFGRPFRWFRGPSPHVWTSSFPELPTACTLSIRPGPLASPLFFTIHSSLRLSFPDPHSVPCASALSPSQSRT